MSLPPAAHALAHLLPEDLGGLLPGELEPYAPVVRSGLLTFVSNLPPARQQAIAERQAELPAGAPLEQRLFALLHASPVLHKLGQVVARDARLDPRLRAALQLLETMPPTTPVAEVHQIVERELEASGQRERVQLGAALLAEASVATVLPFRWRPAGAEGDVVDGVFKVLRPGAEETLRAELEVLPAVGEALEHESRRLGVKAPDYGDAFEQVRALLAREIRLDVEQENLERAATVFRDWERIRVPEPLPLSTPHMTAMTRLRGTKLTEAAVSPRQARTLARALVDALVARPLLEPQGRAPFHADPHAGNLMATDDGAVGLLDWSLVGELEKRERIDLSRLLIATLNLDAGRMARIVERLADAPLDRSRALLPIRNALQALRIGDLPTLSSVFSMLDDVATDASVRFGGNLILFRKSVHSIQGVLHDLSPGFSMDRHLLLRTVEQAVSDLPRRWLSGPFSHGYGTHLSNFDLARLMTSGPSTLLRHLRGQTRLDRRRAGS